MAWRAALMWHGVAWRGAALIFQKSVARRAALNSKAVARRGVMRGGRVRVRVRVRERMRVRPAPPSGARHTVSSLVIISARAGEADELLASNLGCL